MQPRSFVPLLPVSDLARSLAFYGKLGFGLRDSFMPEGAPGPTWAHLAAEGAQLMLGLAEAAPPQPGLRFYLYLEGVAAAHTELQAAGLGPGPIARPFYCPGGEFEVRDPDGHCIMVTHV